MAMIRTREAAGDDTETVLLSPHGAGTMSSIATSSSG